MNHDLARAVAVELLSDPVVQVQAGALPHLRPCHPPDSAYHPAGGGYSYAPAPMPYHALPPAPARFGAYGNDVAPRVGGFTFWHVIGLVLTGGLIAIVSAELARRRE